MEIVRLTRTQLAAIQQKQPCLLQRTTALHKESGSNATSAVFCRPKVWGINFPCQQLTTPRGCSKRKAEVCKVGRTRRMPFMIATVTVAMLTITFVPAMAFAAPETANSVIFFPAGNGATYSCTGGPPYVYNGHDLSAGNCSLEHIGAPAGFVCDAPTSITFVHDMHQEGQDARLCHSSTGAAS
jgi:hypothetical protein